MSIDASGLAPADAGQTAVLAGRARRLLVGGMLGAHALALPVVVGAAVLDGARGAVSALSGLALVVVFQVLGQATQIRFAGADPRVLMRASLVSYALRTAGLGLLLLGWVNLPAESVARINPTAVAVAAAAAVLGWMLNLVRTYSKLRIPVYDEPVAPAPGAGARPSGSVYDDASEITPGGRSGA
ncbi:hypothetical protein GC722_08440 [Auraticoccus sp. F435]|uniref:Uncharacterized protein n=1 Tax=Auraticoccus cholistanensis TaxID=2656650 RepID=A0A6A9V0W2_9ACTN|nr:hypothetical protein [Auraticoccus cholistanensis]MVA76050.1 hypothetical protein [Auraticoccus cholistanensis]